MNIGIIGNGGREHALCHSLKKSKKINEIFCFPGNAGTSAIAKNININTNEFEKLKKFFLEKEIKLVIVGPEKPLVDGIVDFCVHNFVHGFVDDICVHNFVDGL